MGLGKKGSNWDHKREWYKVWGKGFGKMGVG